jgi:hypothetical protein
MVCARFQIWGTWKIMGNLLCLKAERQQRRNTETGVEAKGSWLRGEKLRTCLKDTEGCLSKQGEQYDQSAIIKNDIDQNGQKITVESVQNMERKKQKSGVDGFCFPLQTHPFQFSLWTTTLRGSFSGKKQRQSEGRTGVRSQGLSAWVPCCRCLHTGHPSVGSLSSNCHEKRKRKWKDKCLEHGISVPSCLSG